MMYNASYGLFALLLSYSLAAHTPQQEPFTTALYIRNATVSDAHAITNIIQAAFNHSAHWEYAYQFKDKYPQEHHDCFFHTIQFALGLKGVLAEVALLPNITAPHEPTPIAVALWVEPDAWLGSLADFPSLGLSHQTTIMGCEHRDVNMTRWNDYVQQFSKMKQKYLDDVYMKRNQLYLDSLATHPDYQRQGAGSALVRSGLSFGKSKYKNENVTATLIATEAGEPLYQYLGWESMHNYSVKSLDVINGTREAWRFDVMRCGL